MQIGKVAKWSVSAARIAVAKARLGRRLHLPRGGKPVYLGRGVRLVVEGDGVLELGCGAYIDDYCRLQVSRGARMSFGKGCYLNTNCRVVAVEDVEIGAHTMFGPNVCVFDHDHVFDAGGVRRDLISAPIVVGERCWLGANSLVTGGVSIADKICVGGGCVVTHPLVEPGVYVGAPSRLLRRFGRADGGQGEPPAESEEVRLCDRVSEGPQQPLIA